MEKHLGPDVPSPRDTRPCRLVTHQTPEGSTWFLAGPGPVNGNPRLKDDSLLGSRGPPKTQTKGHRSLPCIALSNTGSTSPGPNPPTFCTVGSWPVPFGSVLCTRGSSGSAVVVSLVGAVSHLCRSGRVGFEQRTPVPTVIGLVSRVLPAEPPRVRLPSLRYHTTEGPRVPVRVSGTGQGPWCSRGSTQRPPRDSDPSRTLLPGPPSLFSVLLFPFPLLKCA